MYEAKDTPCIKTGADVWITSHDGYLHGDMFLVAGVYYLRFVGDVYYGADQEYCDFVIDNDGAPENQVLMIGNTLIAAPFFVKRKPVKKNS